MIKIYYEIEEFEYGTFEIGCSQDDKEEFMRDMDTAKKTGGKIPKKKKELI